jgi:hypothetical protein
MPQKLLHARVDEVLERAVLAKARQLNVTPSEAIRRALQAWVNDSAPPPQPAVPEHAGHLAPAPHLHTELSMPG